MMHRCRESSVGEATAVSRTGACRQQDERPAGGGAVGTRDRIIAHLARVAEIADRTGMASTRLAEAVGYPGSSVAFAQLLSGMERDGLISREVRGKRTYRITLSAPTAAGRGAEPPLRADGSAACAAFSAGVDYDELADRVLIRCQAAGGHSGRPSADRGRARAELATAWSRHGTLTAENVRLREELVRTQRDLDSARDLNRKAAFSDELSEAEVVLLERLLTQGHDSEGQESGGPLAEAPQALAVSRAVSM